MQIIAEIGKNFIDTEQETDVSTNLIKAHDMVAEAESCGATTVKFQCHVFEDEQRKRDKSRYEWIQRNERATPFEEFFVPIQKFCEDIGIEFLCTPMSRLAAEKINPLVKRWKVGSADINDVQLLDYIKSTGKPVILSTGMSTIEQIDWAVDCLGEQIEFINYCVSLYPCPIWKIDLRRIVDLRNEYEFLVGLSDHSLSIEVPALAVRMGAVAVEKHFTFDRNAWGPDHKASLLPNEFKEMAELCERAELDGESFEQEKKHWDKFRV